GAPSTPSRALALELPLAAEINRVRRSYGLRALTLSAALVKAAVAHAEVLASAGYFSHAWSDGSPFGSWIQRFYPSRRARFWGAGERFYPSRRARFWSAGENLLWSSDDLGARSAVAAWLASPPHRRNLL